MVKVFISYSWDDEDHKKWVTDLANKLRDDKVFVTLDQWSLSFGDQLTDFMERSIRENDFVLIICTPRYKEKSNNRIGGVGYEGDIMTAEIYSDRNQKKFIPILAKGDWKSSSPSWLLGKYYIDMKDFSSFSKSYPRLLSTLMFGETTTQFEVKTVSQNQEDFNNADNSIQNRKTESGYSPVKIVGIMLNEITTPTMDGSQGSALYSIPFKLSREPSYEWREFFVHSWNNPPKWSNLHRPGIAHVFSNKIVLDGTTIEEVENTHKETLQLCLDVANKKDEEYQKRKRIKEEEEEEENKIQKHKESVASRAKKISFD